MNKFPYKAVVTPLIQEDECPYCYLVEHVRSKVFYEHYEIAPMMKEDLLYKKIPYEKVREMIVAEFVLKGWERGCEIVERINPVWFPSGWITYCPNCGFTSDWRETQEEAKSWFSMNAHGKVRDKFTDEVRELIDDN